MIRLGVFLIFVTNFLFAQEEGELLHAERHKYDPTYRANYFDKKIFKLDINSDVENYSVPNLNKSADEESRLIPNQKSKLRASFDYRFLGLFVSFSPDFTSNNTAIYGQTKTLDLSFKYFYSDRLRQEVDYKKILGFYLENPNEDLPIDLYPNLEINTFGGKTFYIMNNNFSYRAFDNMTERQLKSAGSMIPSLGYYYNVLKSKRINDVGTSLTQIYSFDAFLQFGYMYNLVLSKKWFTTIGAHPGVGINNSRSYFYDQTTLSESVVQATNYNLNIDLNFSLGYNNKNFFSGIKSNFREYQYGDSNTAELINSKFYLDFFVGYRFNEDKRLKKIFDFIENKIF